MRALRGIGWLVFAEDWGGHPSTAQHLVAHLPEGDRVVWVGSIGMRAPSWSSTTDLARMARRLAAAAGSAIAKTGAPAGGLRAPDEVVHPLLIPWHRNRAAVALNRAILRRLVTRALARHGIARPVVMTANPVVAKYLGDVVAASGGPVVYLRSDDFAALPGVDPELVRETEPAMLARADLIVVPNARLAPERIARERVELIAQGVDVERFAAVPLEPPRDRPLVLGYWGSLSEWLDLDLVAAVARAREDLRLELRGAIRPAVRARLAELARLPNVSVLPAVPHAELAAAAAHWHAAWAPLSGSLQLPFASPLKLREYLAAGLPSACTPIPEARAVAGLTVVADRDEVLAWLDRDVLADTAGARAARRAAMLGESWRSRSDRLRERVLERLGP